MNQLKIGKFLAALRKEKQMTQEQLAGHLFHWLFQRIYPSAHLPCLAF
ncbi:helix-turn-helix domain-containing protein [Murdochiella sp. Marseille-P8839]|nr:helix-turn-helix domain-containing protein [Murdochiella sp. Marseille-P8839]